MPDSELPDRPAPPEPGDCCGGGCARCVHDLYADALEAWQREVERRTRLRETGENSTEEPGRQNSGGHGPHYRRAAES